MKAVFIAYNQSVTEMVQDVLDELSIKGYTQWTEVNGRGSLSGNPHLGTHTWPEMNNVHLAMVDDSQLSLLLENLKQLNHSVEKEGIRAFVWNIESSI